MTKTENGYAPNLNKFHELLNEMVELRSQDMTKWEMVDMDPLLDSSNMTVDDWNKIGEVINNNYCKYDGFVILHGTDTMAYTASALSFMLENLGKPVVITGSQIPLCEIRSDGKDNIITSLMIAGEGTLNEVCVYFSGELMRGNRTTKYSSDGFDAFKSPNFLRIAKIGIKIEINKQIALPKPEGDFNFQRLDNVPIGVIKVFPGIQFELFEKIMTESLKGVVIEAFGAGNTPSEDKGLPEIIRKAKNNGTVITVCTQCTKGAVMLGTYETSSGLKKAGAVSGMNMTTEACVAKLYYLFSKGYDFETISKLMETSIRGELS